MYKEGEGNARLYIDENEQYYVQKNIGSQLEKVDSREKLAEFAQKDKEERDEGLEKLKNSYKNYEYYPVDNLYPVKKYLGTAKDKIKIEKDGIGMWRMHRVMKAIGLTLSLIGNIIQDLSCLGVAI